MSSSDNSPPVTDSPVIELTNLIKRDNTEGDDTALQREQDKSVQLPAAEEQPEYAAEGQADEPPATDSPEAQQPGVLQGQAVLYDKISEKAPSKCDMKGIIEDSINKALAQMHECLRTETGQDMLNLSMRIDSLEKNLETRQAQDMRMQEAFQALQNQLNLATTRLNSLNKEVQGLLAMSSENNAADNSPAEGREQPELAEGIRQAVSQACADIQSSLSKAGEDIISLEARDSAMQSRLDQFEDYLKEMHEMQSTFAERLDALQAEQDKRLAEGPDNPGSLSRYPGDIQEQAEDARKADDAVNETLNDALLRLEAIADAVDRLEEHDSQKSLLLSEVAARIELCEAKFADEAMEQLAAKACARVLREEIQLLKGSGK